MKFELELDEVDAALISHPKVAVKLQAARLNIFEALSDIRDMRISHLQMIRNGEIRRLRDQDLAESSNIRKSLSFYETDPRISEWEQWSAWREAFDKVSKPVEVPDFC